MGATKRALEEFQDNVGAAAALLVREGHLQHCERHSVTYGDLFEPEDEDLVHWAEELGIESKEDMRDVFNGVHDNIGDECGYCAKNYAD